MREEVLLIDLRLEHERGISWTRLDEYHMLIAIRHRLGGGDRSTRDLILFLSCLGISISRRIEEGWRDGGWSGEDGGMHYTIQAQLLPKMTSDIALLQTILLNGQAGFVRPQ